MKSRRFLLKINDLEQIYIAFQQIYPRFGDREVIFLRYMDISMAHLRTKKVLRRIQFRHHCPVCVTEVVIFEVYPHALYLPRGIFHGVHRLDLPVWEAVHKLRGRNFASVQVINEALFLFPDGGKLDGIFRPPPRQVLKIHFQFVVHVDCPSAAPRLNGDELDKPVLILHLPVNGDCP